MSIDELLEQQLKEESILKPSEDFHKEIGEDLLDFKADGVDDEIIEPPEDRISALEMLEQMQSNEKSETQEEPEGKITTQEDCPPWNKADNTEDKEEKHTIETNTQTGGNKMSNDEIKSNVLRQMRENEAEMDKKDAYQQGYREGYRAAMGDLLKSMGISMAE